MQKKKKTENLAVEVENPAWVCNSEIPVLGNMYGWGIFFFLEQVSELWALSWEDYTLFQGD